MADEEQLMNALMNVCRKRLHGENLVNESRSEAAAILWELYQREGRHLQPLLDAVHGRLAAEFTPDERARLGLSRGTIRNAVERPRPPTRPGGCGR